MRAERMAEEVIAPFCPKPRSPLGSGHPLLDNLSRDLFHGFRVENSVAHKVLIDDKWLPINHLCSVADQDVGGLALHCTVRESLALYGLTGRSQCRLLPALEAEFSDVLLKQA